MTRWTTPEGEPLPLPKQQPAKPPADISRMRRSGPRRLHWGPFAVGTIATILATVPGWYALRWLDHWYGWVALVVDAAVVLLFAASAVGALLKKDSPA